MKHCYYQAIGNCMFFSIEKTATVVLNVRFGENQQSCLSEPHLQHQRNFLGKQLKKALQRHGKTFTFLLELQSGATCSNGRCKNVRGKHEAHCKPPEWVRWCCVEAEATESGKAIEYVLKCGERRKKTRDLGSYLHCPRKCTQTRDSVNE